MKGAPLEKVKKFLDVVFREQLGKFYSAATYEKTNLLDYYQFSSSKSESVKKNVEKVYGKPASEKTLTLEGESFPNPYFFYRDELDRLHARANGYGYSAFVHGDLNGANIIIDQQENVWIIDFFHTHRGHILKDLVKLENDLLYIFTPITGAAGLQEAMKISKALFNVRDLVGEMPPASSLGLSDPVFIRTYETLCTLRSYYKSLVKTDRNPTQLYIAQMRYAMHTLVFDECNDWQRKWALYNAGHFGEIIRRRLTETGPLRIDWLETRGGKKNVGLTILPGRRDFSRDIKEDIREIKNAGISMVVPLLTADEMNDYGIKDLLTHYKNAELEVVHLPIMDQRTCTREEMQALVQRVENAIGANKKVLVHCVGGLGRSGMLAACILRHEGMSAKEAIQKVRAVRSPRAVETKEQEEFVGNFE
jgi:protein-tyrosine phosphatase